MTKIKGNNDGPNRRNETYDIGKRKDVPRPQVVKEIKEGKHLVLMLSESTVGNTQATIRTPPSVIMSKDRVENPSFPQVKPYKSDVRA
jgi:hypothetical protein